MVGVVGVRRGDSGGVGSGDGGGVVIGGEMVVRIRVCVWGGSVLAFDSLTTTAKTTREVMMTSWFAQPHTTTRAPICRQCSNSILEHCVRCVCNAFASYRCGHYITMNQKPRFTIQVGTELFTTARRIYWG